MAEAKERIDADAALPDGILLDWGGSFENLQQAASRLSLLVPLVLLLIFVLLQANFRSARVTLLVYANVPLAVTGGLVALFVRGLPLSISAAVGFIALFGIAVMNGVVLVSCTVLTLLVLPALYARWLRRPSEVRRRRTPRTASPRSEHRASARPR